MPLTARLSHGESLGDRVLKVDHAGEHGAVCIYKAQQWFARWRAPEMVAEIDEFILHEQQHRSKFGAELTRRNRARCKSYWLCGIGGLALGALTGLAGRQAIAATTVAVERVVLKHLKDQANALASTDAAAVSVIRAIILDEQAHHDRSAAHLPPGGIWQQILDPIVSASTEAVIWLGMKL